MGEVTGSATEKFFSEVALFSLILTSLSPLNHHCAQGDLHAHKITDFPLCYSAFKDLKTLISFSTISERKYHPLKSILSLLQLVL